MRRIDYDTEQYQDYARGPCAHRAAVADVDRRLRGGCCPSGVRWRDWTSARGPAGSRPRCASVSGRSPASSRRSACARWRGAVPASRRAVSGGLRRGPAGTVGQRRLRAHVPVLAPRPGQARAVRELARVLRRAGGCCCAPISATIIPRPWWLAHFPARLCGGRPLFQPLHEASRCSRRTAGASPASARHRTVLRHPREVLGLAAVPAYLPLVLSRNCVPTKLKQASAALRRLSRGSRCDDARVFRAAAHARAVLAAGHRVTRSPSWEGTGLENGTRSWPAIRTTSSVRCSPRYCRAMRPAGRLVFDLGAQLVPAAVSSPCALSRPRPPSR